MTTELPDVAPGHAVAVDWSAERYHADTQTTSRSHLVELLERPAQYYAVREARTSPPPKPTAAMAFGTDVHTAALEPTKWPARARELNQEDAARILSMAASFHSHPMVQDLFSSPYACEQTVIWRPEALAYELDGEERFGTLLVRVRVDALIDLGDVAIVLDLKTSANPSPSSFALTCARHRYYLQAAMYRDAVAALYPDKEVHFVFAAVAKDPPFEVACYDLPDDAIELGRNQYRSAMVDLLRRRETGDWRAHWQQSVQRLTLPGWAYYDR